MFSLIFRNPLAQMEEEKKEHDIKMKKMEVEMEQVFEMKVREKKQKLKDSESDVRFFKKLKSPVGIRWDPPIFPTDQIPESHWRI